jgi:hypothetical protein
MGSVAVKASGRLTGIPRKMQGTHYSEYARRAVLVLSDCPVMNGTEFCTPGGERIRCDRIVPTPKPKAEEPWPEGLACPIAFYPTVC